MVGTRRFTLGRQWEEKCEGCPEPLHYTDATYFNDSDVKSAETAGGAAGAAGAAGAGAAGAVALVKEVLRLHHATTTAQRHKEIVEQLGDPPPAHSRERGYGMSMWLASACVALHEACKVQAGDLLATRSTAGRLERVLKVLKAEIAKKYSPPRGRQRG